MEDNDELPDLPDRIDPDFSFSRPPSSASICSEVIEEQGEARTVTPCPVNGENNPWPYVKDFFEFVERKEKNLKYKCVLCKPQTVIVKAHISSTTNLKAHVRKQHESRNDEFSSVISDGSFRGRVKRCRKGWLPNVFRYVKIYVLSCKIPFVTYLRVSLKSFFSYSAVFKIFIL
jgi:hypothetical protein